MKELFSNSDYKNWLIDLKPKIRVSEFILTQNLPENLKSKLPMIEEIENELEKYNEI